MQLQYTEAENPFRIARQFPFALVQITFRPREYIAIRGIKQISRCLWCRDGQIVASGSYGRCSSCGWYGDAIQYLSDITGLRPIQAAQLILQELDPTPKIVSLSEWVHGCLKKLRALKWLIESNPEIAGHLLAELPAIESAIAYLTQANREKLQRLRDLGRLRDRWGVDEF